MNKYHKKVKFKNRYRDYIKVLNGVLQLAEREVDILSHFMLADDRESVHPLDKRHIFSRENRKTIMEDSNILKTNLTKISKKLVSMGIIANPTKKNSYIDPLFKAVNTSDDTFEVTYILDFKEN